MVPCSAVRRPLLLLVMLIVLAQPTRAVAIEPQATADPTGGTAQFGNSSQAGGAAPANSYDEAVNAFKYQDFDSALPLLKGLLYPSTKLDRRREWQVREYLGAALWWTGNKGAASDEFTALLVRDPPHKLDPAVYPPKMVGDFDNLRVNLIRIGVIKADAKPQQEPLDDRAMPPPLGLMFVPLGVGQFANREPIKGTAFLLAEAGLAAVSVTYYLQNRDRGTLGTSNTPGKIVQLSTGGAFWLVATAGIIEAIVQWRTPANPPP